MIVEILETDNQAQNTLADHRADLMDNEVPIAKVGKTLGNAVEQPCMAFGETCEQQAGMRGDGTAGKISLDVLRSGTIGGWTGEPGRSTVCRHGGFAIPTVVAAITTVYSALPCISSLRYEISGLDIRSHMQ